MKFNRLFCFFSVVALVSCASSQNKEDLKWRGEMQRMAVAVSALLPTALSKKDVFSKVEQREVLQSLDLLRKSTSHIERMKKTDRSPLMIEVSDSLNREVDVLYGDILAKRYVGFDTKMKMVVGYCLSCHTRSRNGTDQFAIPDHPRLKKLNAFDLGDYFAATRQYSRAMDAWDKVLVDRKMAIQQSQKWLAAAKKSLLVSVRGRQDPFLALEILARMTEAGSIPPDEAETAKIWKQHVRDWKAEVEQMGSNKTSSDNLFSRIKSLMTEADRQEKNHFGFGFIFYLRAAALLNNFFEKSSPEDSNLAEAYYLAGKISRVTKPVDSIDTAKIYYLACQRSQPKSEIAARCSNELN